MSVVVPDLLSVLCWVLSLSYDPSVHFRAPSDAISLVPAAAWWGAARDRVLGKRRPPLRYRREPISCFSL